MDVRKILEELYMERDCIDQAIRSLEALQLGRGKKRRGRPPGNKNKTDIKEPAAERKED